MLDEERILRDLMNGDFRTTVHADIRMSERNITASDISECARTASKVTEQTNGKYLVQGLDESGEKLEVVCVWTGNTLVITVF